MDDDERLMRRALAVAAMGMAVGEMPIGAVVAVAGDVVAEAYTQERTQGRLLVHADLLAMDAADLALAGQRTRATLYVTLEPCLMCLGAAFTARMGRVVYALESPSDGGVAAFRHWDSTRRATDMPGYRLPAIESGLLREESAALLRDYAATAREGWARDWALACAEPKIT